MVSFEKKGKIYAQGDSTDGLFFIQEGKVQLSVVSEAGKEAILGILSEGDFRRRGTSGPTHPHVVCHCNHEVRPAAC
jgi:CRP/FNR family cyclic AMP-dependent transcriptional regulator